MFLVRALWRCVFAFLWLPVLAVAAVLVLAFLLFAAVSALLVISAAVLGLVFWISHRPPLGEMAFWPDFHSLSKKT